jgi:hypothetical protein
MVYSLFNPIQSFNKHYISMDGPIPSMDIQPGMVDQSEVNAARKLDTRRNREK